MRIWFNRGYSLAAIAGCMINAVPDLEVIISVGEGKPQYEGPTYTFEEPELDPAEYVSWAKEQVKKHAVDLFIPTKHRRHFYGEDMGCKVHFPCTAEAFEIIEDKAAFSRVTKNSPYHLPTAPAYTTEMLQENLAVFREIMPDAQPCIKPLHGVNGHGFWIVDKDTNPAEVLLHPEYRRIDEKALLAILSLEEKAAEISPLVIMEYLPGPEVSVDILCHEGLILKAIARTKGRNSQSVQSKHPLIDASFDIAEQFKLEGVNNIQYRKAKDGTWKILEINARPAGGSVNNEQHGAELIGDWARILTGEIDPESVFWPEINIENKIVTTRVITDLKEEPHA